MQGVGDWLGELHILLEWNCRVVLTADRIGPDAW